MGYALVQDFVFPSNSTKQKAGKGYIYAPRLVTQRGVGGKPHFRPQEPSPPPPVAPSGPNPSFHG